MKAGDGTKRGERREVGAVKGVEPSLGVASSKGKWGVWQLNKHCSARPRLLCDSKKRSRRNKARAKKGRKKKRDLQSDRSEARQVN